MSGSLKDVKHQAVLDNGLANAVLTKCTLAINAGSAATFKTTGTTTFKIAGVMYTKAALSANAFTAGHYVQPVSTTVYYAVTVDAGGTIRTRQSDYAGRLLDAATATGGIGNAAGKMGAVGDGGYPAIPSTEVVLGLIKIVTDASTTFTAGTTALDAAGLTVTFTDMPGSLPATAI